MVIAHEANMILLVPLGATSFGHAAPRAAWLLHDFRCDKHSAPLVLLFLDTLSATKVLH